MQVASILNPPKDIQLLPLILPTLHSSLLTDSMYWNSFSEFLAMGTHGIYVWGSVGVMAILMVLEPVLLVRGHKGLVARLKRQFRAEKTDRSTPFQR